MKKLKMFICMAMAAALLCHTTMTVWAAVTHKEGCNNTTYTYAECGRLLDEPLVKQHMVVVLGEQKQCNVTAEIRMHEILCANSGCRVTMGDDEARMCIKEHSYCGAEAEDQLCKY